MAGSLCLPTEPRAQTTNEILTRWGLLGTWSVNCTKSSGQGLGARLTYVIRQGKPVHLRDFGDRRDESPILRATLAPDQSIELRVNFISLKEIREFAFTRGPDQRIRVKYNRGPKGDYSIFDGKFVANGAEAPWQSRCGN
jgi:hypothetical protein